MRREHMMEVMLDELDDLAARAAQLKCPALERLLAMAHLELRLFSIQAVLTNEAAGLLARIRG